MKRLIVATALSIALGAGGAVFAQTITYPSPTTSPNPTMMQKPSTTPTNGLQTGQGGSGSMPNGAPTTGFGGAQ